MSFFFIYTCRVIFSSFCSRFIHLKENSLMKEVFKNNRFVVLSIHQKVLKVSFQLYNFNIFFFLCTRCFAAARLPFFWNFLIFEYNVFKWSLYHQEYIDGVEFLFVKKFKITLNGPIKEKKKIESSFQRSRPKMIHYYFFTID